LKGYEYAISSPDQAAELAIQYNKDLSLDHQKGYLQAALPLFNPAGSRLGMMTAADWEAAHQILLDQGVLAEPLDVNTVYTLDFLNKIYNE
jgi:ABC-type nitrate/sulfonate/bicarbonate transport system substrate-binding protein